MKLTHIRFVCIVWLFIAIFASCEDNSKSTGLLQQATGIIEKKTKQALVHKQSCKELITTALRNKDYLLLTLNLLDYSKKDIATKYTTNKGEQNIH